MTTDAINHERAERCREALIGYSNDDSFICLIDLLADAMHWCDRKRSRTSTTLWRRRQALPRRTQRRANRRPEDAMNTVQKCVPPSAGKSPSGRGGAVRAHRRGFPLLVPGLPHGQDQPP